MNTYKIIMRSTPPCPFCEKAKALLDKRGLRYEAIDLTGRHTALRVFKALGHTTIPVIIAPNGELIGGFEDLDALLGDQQDRRSLHTQAPQQRRKETQ